MLDSLWFSALGAEPQQVTGKTESEHSEHLQAGKHLGSEAQQYLGKCFCASLYIFPLHSNIMEP